MSDNNNLLLAGALVVGFMMMNRRAQAAPVYAQQPSGAVPSMPGNVGSGWQQIAQGAVAGFLGSLASGPSNNTSQSHFPSYQDPVDAFRGGIAQEAATFFDGYGYVSAGGNYV